MIMNALLNENDNNKPKCKTDNILNEKCFFQIYEGKTAY